MFKNMKLGTKIMVGFGVMIVIAVALGGLAVVKMKGVVGDSVMLAEEYAPESALASLLERRVYRTMYAIRGYNFTGEKKYYEEGAAAMAQVKETIGKAEELAAKAVHLTKLKEQLAGAKQAMTDYERLMVEAEKNLNELAKLRVDLRGLAKKYTDNCKAFLKSRTVKWPKRSQKALLRTN